MWQKLQKRRKGSLQSTSSGRTRESSPDAAVTDVNASLHRDRAVSQSDSSRESGSDSYEALSTASSRTASRHRSQDPLGLTVLYAPQNRRTVDIIFVHGLGGSSLRTWTKHGNPETRWPQFWLPLEPEICTARILTFGYNSLFKHAGPNSTSDITDFARSLLSDMRYGRDEEGRDLDIGNKPVIFVAHSLGGLVFKQAYVLGTQTDEFRDIISSISAVLFLATPHHGARFVEVLNWILTVSVFGHSAKQYIADLERNSTTIKDMNDNFRQHVSNLNVFSFYETVETPVARFLPVRMVGKESARMDIPGESQIPLNADHHNVCKFASRHDPNYRSITDILVKLVRAGHTSGSRVQAEKLKTDMTAVQRLLAVSDNTERELAELCNTWAPGTCVQMTESLLFKKFRTPSAEPKIMWLYGHPGSGKSIQASFLVDFLLKEGQNCCFYFLRHQDVEKRSPNPMLRSLALQSSTTDPDFMDFLRALGEDGMRFDKKKPMEIWNRLFLSGLFTIPLSKPLYWVIDGLDESDSPSAIVEMFATIPRDVPIRILITSRRTSTLTKVFDRASTAIDILRLEIKASEQDIRLFALDKLRYMQASDEDRERIIESVICRAEGSFLWVSLVLEEISEHVQRQDAVQDVLASLPLGMKSFYQRMDSALLNLARAEHRSMSDTILRWVLYARRPLTVPELADIPHQDLTGVLDLPHTISKVCGQFVVIDEASQQVQLLHETAREYLIEESELRGRFCPSQSHEELFCTCLQVFLNAESYYQELKSIPPSSFSRYAATCWPYHLRHCEADSDKCLDLLVNFFQEPCVLQWIQALARLDELQHLGKASRAVAAFISRRRKADASKIPLSHRLSDIDLLENWASDLLKIMAKFGRYLRAKPDAIYHEVAPFTPRSSAIYRQFGKGEHSRLSVSGLEYLEWDNCLARVSVVSGHQAVLLASSRDYLAVADSAGTISIWDVETFHRIKSLHHREYMHMLRFNEGGSILISVGYRSTLVWSLPSGELQATTSTPPDTLPLCLAFSHRNSIVWMGCDDRTLRYLHTKFPNPEWETLESPIFKQDDLVEEKFLNSPTTISVNCDASMAAIGYRAAPLSLWDTGSGELINRCIARRREDGEIFWSGVFHVRCHPTAMEVIGIYVDGVVFKWNARNNTHLEAGSELHKGAQDIEFSSDGTLFATTDGEGNFSIYSYRHFSLVHRIMSENAVSAFCFSPDNRRLYDLRRSYCNVWEPNTLLKLAEGEEEGNEVSTQAGSSHPSTELSETTVEFSALVSAVAVRPGGAFLAVGDEDGIIDVVDLRNERKATLASSAVGLSLQHLTWSPTANYIAYSEIFGRVTLYEVNLLDHTGRERVWPPLRRPVLHYDISADYGQIEQLLFSPDGESLLTASTNVTKVISVTRKEVETSYPSEGSRRWINHWDHPGKLVSIGASEITIHTWDGLETIACWKFPPPQESQPFSRPRNDLNLATARIEKPHTRDTMVQEAIVTQDQQHIMITLRSPSSAASVRIISLSQLDPASSAKVLCPIELPAEILEDVREPVDIIKRKCFVYINKANWICSWKLDSEAVCPKPGGPQVSGHEKSSLAVEPTKRFFLPPDWVHDEKLHLCKVLRDRTLLFPQKGQVAVIRGGLGSAW